MKPALSIEAFAEFCEKQPADAEYPYTWPNNCACAQYQKSLGIYGSGWLAKARRGSFWDIADYHANKSPHTFGALAARLRASQ